MKRSFTGFSLLAGFIGFASLAVAQQYQVTVTNMAHGTPYPSLVPNPASVDPGKENAVFMDPSCKDANGTPRIGEMLGLWVFITHNKNFNLFQEGQPASRELAMLSQTGRPFFLRDDLKSNPDVGNIFTVPNALDSSFNPRGIVLCPGQSMTTTVNSNGDRFLSLAAMIFPTNDGFVGLNAVPLPTGNAPVEYYSPAYDSGSEENDELCGDIPSLRIVNFPFPATTKGGAMLLAGVSCPDGSGPQDFNSTFEGPNAKSPTGEDSNNPARAEGTIHVHPGIRGIGDLDPAVWNWKNNVLKVTIQKALGNPGGQR